MAGPGQPAAVGVIVKVTSCGVFVVLVNEPVIGVPDPPATMPVTFTLLSLVHVYVVDGCELVNTILVMADPLQIVCEDGVAVATGNGIVVISCDAVVLQPLLP